MAKPGPLLFPLPITPFPLKSEWLVPSHSSSLLKHHVLTKAFTEHVFGMTTVPPSRAGFWERQQHTGPGPRARKGPRFVLYVPPSLSRGS